MHTRRGRLASSRRRASIFLPIWLASIIWLWSWWLNPEHIGNYWLYIPLTLALVYENIVMPGFLLFSIRKAKNPPNRRPIKNSKVALITPCVPAKESLEIIEKQLAALVAVEYPHDSWILDEGNNKQIKKLARKYGVKYFSRKGKKKYNQETYPFMAKTKSGNINAWLHHAKRYKYEYFVQLDIDHIPHPDYLHKTLGQFRDKKVGWVQAPSVYNNLQYWAARGSAEQDLGLHGPVQMGFYGNSDAPVIIGSHTTFRMSAIESIGGFQQTRAEDHLNTLALMADGWNGVFIPEVIAEGDGPETFNTYIAQQYAWARSMTQILYRYSFRHLKKTSWKRRIQYLFMQTWYPATTLTYLAFFLVPVISLLGNTPPTNMTGQDFLIRFPVLVLGASACYWVGKPLLQPANVRFSWRGALLHIIRWPIILQAMLGVLFRRQKSYQITPKGKGKRPQLVPSVRLYMPFLFISLINALAIIYATLFHGYQLSAGQIIFSLLNLTAMLAVCLIDLNIRLRQGMRKLSDWSAPLITVSVITVLSGLAFVLPFTPNQTTLAYDTVPKIQNTPTEELNITTPKLLSDEELLKEISSSDYKIETSELPTLGFYSGNRVINTNNSYIRHTFVDWRDSRQLKEQLLISERAKATSLITIEPGIEDGNGAKMLTDITAGVYDERLLELIKPMQASPNQVYVRFAHEMDLQGIYPWGQQNPDLYKSAYQHVVNLARFQGEDNLKWVWSPAGTNGAEVYYPGDRYVDIIGTTMLYDSYFSGDYVPTFNEIQLTRKWLQAYGKPIWICELGIGNKDAVIQNNLIKSAVNEYSSAGYQALIYLDSPDNNLVGPDYTLQDKKSLVDWFSTAASQKPLSRKPIPIPHQNTRFLEVINNTP